MKTIIYAILAASLCACATPRATAPITRDTLAYSAEVARAQQEQLLLNIVRLRYNDPVSFVEIERMTTEDSRTVGLGLATAFSLDGSPLNEVLGAQAAGEQSQTPAAIYNVLRGGAYAQQLLQPVGRPARAGFLGQARHARAHGLFSGRALERSDRRLFCHQLEHRKAGGCLCRRALSRRVVLCGRYLPECEIDPRPST